MYAIINMTPHDVVLYSINDCQEVTKGTYKSLVLKEGAKALVTYPSQGVARASATREQVDIINDVPVFTTKYGQVEGLPEEREDTYYIVSALTAQAARYRADLLIIDGAVRDSEGRIIGCTSFGRI